MEQSEKPTRVKSTEMAKQVRPIVKGMSARAHEARAKGEPITHCFIMSLYDEIIRSMDLVPVWTENWAGVCAAKRDALRFIDKAESEGYARNLCTYATCGIGFDAMCHESGQVPENTPDGGMPAPTVMLGTGMNICDPRYKWYQTSQRYNDAPVHIHGLLWPPIDGNIDEVQDYYIKYVTEELRGLVEFLEKYTGKKMDWDRLNATIDLANRTNQVWWDAYQLRKAIPSPMSTGDAMNTMVPGWFMMGTQEAYDFYKGLYDEIKYRVDNKIGVTPDEKYRLLWAAGLPPWFALAVFNYSESLGAVFAIEVTYHPLPPVSLLDIPASITHPLERLAWRFFKQNTYRYKKAQQHTGDPYIEQLLEMIDDYKIDGVVAHRAFSCRTAHVGQFHLLNVLKEYADLPRLILESDIVDVRTYNEADTKSRIEAFIEMVDANKKNRS